MTDLFLFMILAFVIVFICGLFIYFGGKAYVEIENSLGGQMFGTANSTEVIRDTIGVVNQTYQALYWISIMLIVGMIISIFIGSYLVTTKPVFFIPYFFIVIIAVIVSAGLSNAYVQVISEPLLASTFEGFVGANFIMMQLPIWISIIGIVGGIIMFVNMGSRENELYGGGA